MIAATQGAPRTGTLRITVRAAVAGLAEYVNFVFHMA
jgi:hypothetical protein